MDTRRKILEPGETPPTGQPVTLATGYFDVLRAAQLADLEALRKPGYTLLVAVRPQPNAILPLRARAEMVAALRMVDYVVTSCDDELDALVTALKPAHMVRLEAGEQARASQLKQHVQRRQSS